jgi:phosphatidylethanolamine-binding protein (PEBP) family uncharacterized protein
MARYFYFVAVLIILGIIVTGGYWSYYHFFKNVNNNPQINKNMKQLILTSPVFENMGKIPVKYTCDGEGINPPLQISGTDNEPKSLVLIMDDPDAPGGTFVHWVKFNLSPALSKIEEGSDPKYIGSCPPDREHRYFFKLYSLDTVLDLKQGANKTEIENVMQGHILQQAELVGLYKRQ